MVNIGILIAGIVLLIIAGIGFIFPINDRGYSITQINEICTSDLGLLGKLFSEDLQKVCLEYSYLTYGIYGFGLIGIILIIVGAVVPSQNLKVSTVYHEKTHENRKDWLCEHCKFQTKTEQDLIEHYKTEHSEKKGDTFDRKYGKKQISSENLEILKRRYAQGEITKEEFEQMKKDLENS